jgi:hypothetical protein
MRPEPTQPSQDTYSADHASHGGGLLGWLLDLLQSLGM